MKKPWWRRYGGTFVIVIVMTLVAGHTRWFVLSNPPPRLEELQSQRVDVLNWQMWHPQLHVRLASGLDRMVEFPTLSLRRDMYYVISHEEQRQLIGKTCQMCGRPLRFSIQDHYQVFALDCGDGKGLKFEKSLEDYLASFNWHLNSLSGLFSIVLLGTVTFLAETFRSRKSPKRY